MSVRRRFALLFGLLLLGFTAALAGLQWLEARERQRNALALWQQREQLLDHWLSATVASLRDYAAETARDPASVANPALAGHRDPVADALWLVPADDSSPSATPPPVSPDETAQWTRRPPPERFFSVGPGGRVLEICVQPLRASPAASPTGWLLAARHWDGDHLKLLSGLTEGQASLAAHAAPVGGAIHVRALRDWRGRPVRWLQVAYATPAVAPWFEIRAPQTGLFFAFGLLLVAAFALSLHQWVLRPMQQIGASLAQGDAGPIRQLRTKPDELGDIARLLDLSLAQRHALRTEIAERQRAQTALVASEASLRHTLAERTQLGRNLHDGVIQSLYATGMGLAGIRALLKPEQDEASARLEQSRAALNQTITDVRNFINGLEPESLRQQAFTEAVTTLLKFMQTIRPARLTCAIDEAVVPRLTLAQRANLLHITREAVSNALRHGQADTVHVSLTGTPAGGALFTINDDGRGFSTRSNSSGLGLGNFAGRAGEIGATYTVDSQPGHGTRLSFSFNPPHSV